jgi:proline iminopeptidase
VFRIVVYDQRGAGDSKPFGRIQDNSPDLLVGDLEKLRTHLGIENWHVSGGSWGSTLALLYAEAHPDKVKSLTLRGIFMMRQRELDFLYQQGDTFFPEAFAKLRDFIPEAERNDLILAYFNRISQGDEQAARVWTRYESSCSYLMPPTEQELASDTLTHILGMALMETHFFVNHRFQPDDRILKDIGRIQHIPTHIVQGRYDNVCPPFTAWDLKKAMPNATMELVMAGHAARDPEMRKALLRAHDRIRDAGSPVLPPAPAAPTPQI